MAERDPEDDGAEATPRGAHHRGAHPDDAALFGDEVWPRLREAAGDLAWLLGRGYTTAASLALVGNRFQLEERQRTALMRSVCADAAVRARAARRLDPADLAGRELWLDGFNVIMTVEAALAGGTLLLGRDGCVRNLAPIHGSYRRVAETVPALDLIGKLLSDLGVARARWLLDAPVSNSGRLKGQMMEVATARGWPWDVALEPHVDAALKVAPALAEDGRLVAVATTDSVILDACRAWLDLAGLVIASAADGARVVRAFG